MSIKFSKGFMMSGRDFKLTDSLTLHHPSVNDIYRINNGYMSEQLYWSYVSSLMCDPYTNMVMLDDMGRDFMKTSPFEILILTLQNKGKEDFENHIGLMKKALELFLSEQHDFELAQYGDGNFCLLDRKNENCQINEPIFHCIYEWLLSVNKIDHSKKIKPADENARRILLEDARAEIRKAGRRKQKKDADTEFFGNLMSSICFGGNGSATPFNIMDYKIYWLLENQSVISRKQHSDNLFRGIYGGTISSKDIDKKDLDWMN